MRAGHRRPGAEFAGHVGPQQRDGDACVQVRLSSGDINCGHLFNTASNHTTAAAVNIDLCVTSALIIAVIYDTSQKNTAI